MIIHGDFTESEVEKFLSTSLSPLRLATLDESGYPLINSVGFYFEQGRIYIFTGPKSRKAKNFLRTNKVYFSVDTDLPPYKGVKGRAHAKIMNDYDRELDLVKKIALKFTGNLDNPMSQFVIEQVRSRVKVAVELTPVFYSTWG